MENYQIYLPRCLQTMTIMSNADIVAASMLLTLPKDTSQNVLILSTNQGESNHLRSKKSILWGLVVEQTKAECMDQAHTVWEEKETYLPRSRAMGWVLMVVMEVMAVMEMTVLAVSHLKGQQMEVLMDTNRK